MRVILYGAGGHARVVLDAARAAGHQILFAIDDRRELHGGYIDGVQILGPETPYNEAEGIILGVGSVDTPNKRAALYDRAVAFGLALPVVRHPAAVIAPTAILDQATVVFAGAVINPHTRIGRNVIVNTASVIEHDCVVGDHVHISPGALIAGGVSIGSGSHVGIGAVLLQGVRVGTDVMVAAGAVVLQDVHDGGRVAGVPARSMA